MGALEYFLYFLILLCTLIYGLTYIFTRYYNYWNDRNVTHEKPVLFFGTKKDFLIGKANIGEDARRIYTKYPNENFVGSYNSRWPEMVVRDPELIKSILVKDFQHFMFREKPFHYESEPILTNLFHLNSERWKVLRNKISPAFTSGKLKNMYPLIMERAVQLKIYLDEETKVSSIIEVRDVMAKFTTDVIGSCAFGIEMNSMKDDDAPFRQIGKVIFDTGIYKVFRVVLRETVPDIANLLKINLFKPEVFSFMSHLVKQILEQRKYEVSNRKDFIDLMIEIKKSGRIYGQNFAKKNSSDEESVDLEITDDIVVAQAFIFFAAGFETSSTASSFTLYELALNTEIQETLYAEITNVLEKHNGELTYENINEMKYLEMVINESLRKYPPLSILSRQCTIPYTIPGTNVNIDTNCSVIIPVAALHHDPKYYPNPEIFDPERFSSEAIKSRHPFVYLPFGFGPRNCIGARFGKVQTMIGLITVLQNFKVDVCKETDKSIILEPSSFVTKHNNGIWLRLTKR